jgi:hypothetical protein
VGIICLLIITTKEIERSAAIESEDIRLALAIIFAAVDRRALVIIFAAVDRRALVIIFAAVDSELIPICVPSPEKIRILTTKTAITVNADIIIPL